MSDLTKNLLSIYYGFTNDKIEDKAKLLTTREITDELLSKPNDAIINDSYENASTSDKVYL